MWYYPRDFPNLTTSKDIAWGTILIWIPTRLMDSYCIWYLWYNVHVIKLWYHQIWYHNLKHIIYHIKYVSILNNIIAVYDEKQYWYDIIDYNTQSDITHKITLFNKTHMAISRPKTNLGETMLMYIRLEAHGNNVDTMSWPAESPDLNIVANLW